MSRWLSLKEPEWLQKRNFRPSLSSWSSLETKSPWSYRQWFSEKQTEQLCIPLRKELITNKYESKQYSFSGNDTEKVDHVFLMMRAFLSDQDSGKIDYRNVWYLTCYFCFMHSYEGVLIAAYIVNVCWYGLIW